MKLLFLGTGAADWDISHPNTTRDFRRFSSAVIDGELLIDPGPCIFEFADSFGYNGLLENIKWVINTHLHNDHYSQESLDRLVSHGAEFIDFGTHETRKVGGYSITAVPANHATCPGAKHFIIEADKTVFYGLDGAWLTYDEVAEINKRRFDLMIFDGTVGDAYGDYRIFEHNDLRMVEEMKYTLSRLCPRFMISHMARTLHTCHAELEARMAKSGIEVAYDNLKVEV